MNEDKKSGRNAEKLPDDWANKHVMPERTRLSLLLEPLDKDQTDAILANATSREDFHNYNWFASADADWGICLCEIRIVTGSACRHHLSGSAQEQKKHWAWYLDIAPRGKLCPRVRRRLDNENPGDERALRCRDIILGMPSGEWVLERKLGDVEPGRAVTDVMRTGQCMKCARYQVSEKTNLAFVDQRYVLVNGGPWVMPMKYNPPDGEQVAHGTLVRGHYYHKERLDELKVPRGHRLDVVLNIEWPQAEPIE